MHHAKPPPLAAPRGRHVLADFHGASNLVDFAPFEAVLRGAAEAAGATVLDVRLHGFGTRAGFTGVAVLAESHISVHTWPEAGYAALDVFLCGTCDPEAALDVLRAHFRPERVEVTERVRGPAVARG